VSNRINRATPITPTSLVAIALLGSGDTALSMPEVLRSLHNIVHYVRRRELSTTGPLQLDTADGVRRTLDLLVENGIVTCYDEGPEAVYAIGADQHLAASYYRNTIIHFFVNGAIAELALLHAAETTQGTRLEEFWTEAMRLRDLLKFEFFFAEKDEFREEIRREVSGHVPEWETRLAEGPDEIQRMLREVRPYSSHRVLQPFLDAYRFVADALAADTGAITDSDEFLRRCLALGHQYQLQRRIRSAESVSRVAFEAALRLASNRDLLGDGQAVQAARLAFAVEIRQAVRRAELIGVLAAGRRHGLPS
jgi:glycerol-3-phosphate O-acyltransferase